MLIEAATPLAEGHGESVVTVHQMIQAGKQSEEILEIVNPSKRISNITEPKSSRHTRGDSEDA